MIPRNPYVEDENENGTSTTNNNNNETNNDMGAAPHAAAGSSNDADEEPPTDPSHIHIRFADPNDNELSFKLKKTTVLKKAKDAFAQRTNRERHTLRFLFDGQNVLDEDTPEKLEMEDGDKVEVHMEQLGGGF